MRNPKPWNICYLPPGAKNTQAQVIELGVVEAKSYASACSKARVEAEKKGVALVKTTLCHEQPVQTQSVQIQPVKVEAPLP